MVLSIMLCYDLTLTAVLWLYPSCYACSYLSLVINAVLDFTLIVVICTNCSSCNVLALC